MSVLMHHRVPGMNQEQYDQVLAELGDALVAAPGFQSHYGVFDEDGVLTVVEAWDSEDDHNRWYDANIKPHVGPDAPAHEFAQIRGTRFR